MKNYVFSVTCALLCLFSLPAFSDTLTLGYAQSHILSNEMKNKKSNIYDNTLHGFNLKYKIESDNQIGMIASATGTFSHRAANRKQIKKDKLSHLAFSVGPAWQFNHYFSLYATAGLSYTTFSEEKEKKEEPKKKKFKKSGKKIHRVDKVSAKAGVVAGLGLQVTPWKNLVLDMGYEYAYARQHQYGTWVIGAGIRF